MEGNFAKASLSSLNPSVPLLLPPPSQGNFSEHDTRHWTPELRKALNFDQMQALKTDNGMYNVYAHTNKHTHTHPF